MILQVTARTDAPLALSVRRATGNDLETLAHISGSTLRGALAYAWLDTHGSPRDPPDDFKRLFLSGDVRFGGLQIDGALSAPLSARACSRAPRDHPLVDHLLQSAAEVRIGEECKECKAKRRKLRGALHYHRREGFLERSVKTRRIAHTAIDPRLLRAANQQFHSAEVICEDQTFVGSIWAAEPLAQQVLDLITQTPALYLGRGRTRGQGRVLLSVAVQNHPPQVTAQQIQEFNVAAHRFPRLAGRLLFSCTFASPCILLDQWLMSKPSPDSSDIDTGLEGFEVAASFHGLVPIAGWNSAAGLPKSECWAVAAGSAYLFARECTPTPDDFEQLAAALNRAQRDGIGERIGEGFGEAVFCYPFHTRHAEVL